MLLKINQNESINIDTIKYFKNESKIKIKIKQHIIKEIHINYLNPHFLISFYLFFN